MPIVRVLFGAASPLGGVLLAVLAFALAWIIRYAFIEPAALGAACEGSGPYWCPFRTGLIVFTELNGFGWLSLALLAGTLFPRPRARQWLAHAALLTAGAGIILYNATLSAAIAVLAILWLVRCRERAS